MPSILLFGPTGLMGSHTVLALRKAYPAFPLTIYLRNSKLDDYFTSTVGVSRIVHGDFSETDKITSLAAEHEIVINLGSSWDVPLSQAIIAGLKQRPEESKGTLIHISGAGNFVDTSGEVEVGKSNSNAKWWNDDSEEDMSLINVSMLNGGPDVEVLEAGKEGTVNTYMIIPSGVYGTSTGPVKALGTIQYLMHEKAKELGFVPYVGEGSTIFNTIHVEDIPRFILQVLDLSLKEKKPNGSVYSRIFIIGGQDNTWKEVSTAFAQVFHAKGVVDSPVAKSVGRPEAGGGEIPDLMAKGMHIKMDRAKRLGFKATHPSLLDHLHQALEAYDL